MRPVHTQADVGIFVSSGIAVSEGALQFLAALECLYDSRWDRKFRPADSRLPMDTSQSLKDIGLKATLPRKKILELFESSKVRHLSAEDVYKALIAEEIDIGLATVYRVLTQFEQAGLLSRQHFEAGKAVFELNEGQHHDHLVCLQCGRVEEFFDAQIEARQNEIAKEKGFDLHGHSLALYADCTKVDCVHRKAR